MAADQSRILIAEDNPVNARLMVAVLEQAGYEVTIAPDGEKAVALGEVNDYDVILMDVNMPVMDGLEATRRIRAGAAPMRDVTIIALTAEDDGGVQRRCIEAGMNGYLVKPVDKAELMQTIERSITSPRRRML